MPLIIPRQARPGSGHNLATLSGPKTTKTPHKLCGASFWFKPFPALWTKPHKTVRFWPTTPPPRFSTIAHRIVHTRERVGINATPCAWSRVA